MSSVESGPLARFSDDWRDRILSDPDVILDDRDLMRVLIAANERQMGSNIVDMRGIAMERLENRLDRLEDTHRSVIAAAYENLAGTNQIHRAILTLLDQRDFTSFLNALGGDVAGVLRVDSIRLVLESQEAEAPSVAPVQNVLSIVPPGFRTRYVTQGRAVPERKVTLRQVTEASATLFGTEAGWVKSEALLSLDLGPGRRPGLLVMGAEDPHQFRPSQGTDLLAFFAGVFERLMQRWLD